MNPACLALLENDPVARRLVAAWPQVGPWIDGNNVGLIMKWATYSGVSAKDVVRLRQMLFENGICLKDGGVDRTAQEYVVRIAMSRLPRTRREKKALAQETK
jgi:hypothetical protein